MKPTQKPCETCKHYDAAKSDTWQHGNCQALQGSTVLPWWTGCVMHEEKK
jgi:hypothetical protein